MKHVFKAFTLVLAFVLVGFTGELQAQKIMDKLVEDCCAEIKKKDLSKSNDIQKELQDIMMMVFVQNIDGLTKEYGADIANEDKMSKMGEELGMRLVVECPEFMAVAIQMAADDPSLLEDDDDSPSTNSVSGTFQGVEGEDFVMVKIKDSKGKTQSFLWAEPFENAGKLTNARSLKNKEVTVTYEVREFYNGKADDYQEVRVITGISF